MRRCSRRRAVTVLLVAGTAVVPAPAPAQEPVSPPATVTLQAVNSVYNFGGRPSKFRGTATLADGSPAAGRTLIVEGRPHPYRGRFREDFRGTVPPDGRYAFVVRPRRNRELRVRLESGATSRVLRALTFHRSLSGRLGTPRGGVESVREVSATPPGYRLARLYLYICATRRARTCSYLTRGRGQPRDGRLVASARFRVPRRLRGRPWSVRFSYVPIPGFGASPPVDRRRPPARILNTGQDAP